MNCLYLHHSIRNNERVTTSTYDGTVKMLKIPTEFGLLSVKAINEFILISRGRGKKIKQVSCLWLGLLKNFTTRLLYYIICYETTVMI